jgi:tetratricopeptide (TPR) repeat protein
VSLRRQWVFRLVALTVSLFILGGLEGALRLAGYGYPMRFFKKVRVGTQDYLEDNSQFSLRFFPPDLARSAGPILVNANKPPGVYRIFIMGESAAMGDPEPAFGASRYLEALLNERFSGERFEVVNTGITAINSHVILPIARDCARAGGDLWIVYMGNNEMVGPFGGATIFGSQAPPLAFVRLNLAAQRTRVGQLVTGLARKLAPKSGNPPSWMGMEMFAQNRLLPGDRRRKTVYRSFQRNLKDILECGLDSGAAVLLSTVAVNLKDCPPFASMGGSNLPPSDRDVFEKFYSEGLQAESRADFAAASQNYEQATRVAPQSADAQFRYGQCLLRLTNAAAGAHLQLACDADALPFRADSKVNGLIREAGCEFTGRGVLLVDSAAELETNNGGAILGDETFYEHVHFNFDGNYRLALAWAKQIERILPRSIAVPGASAWASQETCECRLGLTDWNRCNVLGGVIRRMQQAPLSSQPNNAARLKSLETEIKRMRQRMDATAASNARELYADALKRAPRDHYLHENFADYLVATGDYSGATAAWRKVHELLPDDYLAYFRIGGLLAPQGQMTEAEASLAQAVQLRPDLSDAWFELGELHASEQKLELALSEYRQAQRLRPQDPGYYYYSGKALSQLNRVPEALEDFRHAIELKPDYWEAHFALGGQFGLADRIVEARREFEEVIRLKPDDAQAHLNLGVALMKQGQLEGAAGQYEQVLRLEPGNKIARDYLAQTRRLQARKY